MKEIKQKADVMQNAICIFGINLVILFPLVFFCGRNYSIDSYSILLNQNEHIINFIGAYRYFGALIYKLVMCLRHNPIGNALFDIITFIIVSNIMIVLMTLTIIKALENENKIVVGIVDAAVMISIINVWFCNILSFPECVLLTTVGVALCYSAVMIFVKVNTIKGCIFSALLLVCATAVYQQFISVYTILVIAILSAQMIKTKDISLKGIIWLYIKPAIVIVMSGTIYFILGKAIANLFEIETNSRIAFSLELMVDNIKYFINHQHSFLKGRGYFSSEILMVSYLILGIVWFILVLRYWIKTKEITKVVLLGLVYMTAYVSAYVPGIISTSHAARAMFALFSIFALFAIGILALTNSKLLKYGVLICLVIVISLNVIKIIEYEIKLKTQNQEDEEWAQQVVDNIKKYECTSGDIITKIVFCNDSEFDSQLESARNVAYAMESIITIYAERQYEFESMPNTVYVKYFGNKNWDKFDSAEQMVFIDDKLYLCCY